MDLISTLSSRHLDAGAAKRCVVVQHQKIRALLDRAHAAAERALDGKRRAADDLVGAIAAIRRTVEFHLGFEERALAVILEEDPAARERRAAWFQQGRDRQREGLAALYREAVAGPSLPMLAAKLAFLTAWLSNDMAEEERALAIAPPPPVVRARRRTPARAAQSV